MSRYKLNFLSFFLILQLFRLAASDKEIEPRIVGGSECDVRDFPFAVAIISKMLCGGSLLTMSHVLTAGHCLHAEDVETTTVSVRSGYTSPPNLIQVRYLERYVVHPKYNKEMMSTTRDIRYDIGIIVVDSPFVPSPVTQTVALPPPGFTANCKDAVAAGIGKMNYKEQILGSRVNDRALQCVRLPIVAPRYCKKTFPRATIDDSILCTYLPGKDTCVGDSGGPLVCNGAIIGTVSYGPTECASAAGAATYSKVEKYLGFIEGVVRPGQSRRSEPVKRNKPTKAKQPVVKGNIFLLTTLFWLLVNF